MVADLSIDFEGVKFDNPFWVGSGPTTGTPEKILHAIKAGWGSAVIKTVGDKIVRKGVRPMYSSLRSNKELVIFENVELITEDPLVTWEKYMKQIKSETDVPIVASIMGDADYAEWSKLAKWSEDHGADIVELNFGCPHGEPEKKSGAYISQHPELVHSYTKEVVDSVGIPVISKLSPNVTDIAEIAKQAELAGAKGVTAINTVQGLMGVIIETETLLPPISGYTTYGGLSGPGVKPMGLYAVSKIFNNTKFSISGVGGIQDWKNAVEYILLGATSVQVVTKTIMDGYDYIGDWKSSMLKWMTDHGYDNPADFKGKLCDRIKSYEFLETLMKQRTSIDDEMKKIRESA